MFLLPSIVVGFALAVILGGRPSRVLEVHLRIGWAVALAILLQVGLFSRLGTGLPAPALRVGHVLSYALLIAFALANRRVRTLLPTMAGMVLNSIAIIVNGGHMPVDAGAARAAGLSPADFANVSAEATHLRFLGDIFALPQQLPFANTFSIGDILIGVGMAAFIVATAFDGDAERLERSLGERFGPLRLPSYRRLLGGKLISSIGDWLTLAALIGWIYAKTSSTGAVAVVLVARLGPPILGSSAAVYLVDRLPKRRLLVLVELSRAAAALVALGGVLGHSLPAVFAALAVSGGLAALSAATVPALMPSLVSDEQLPMANAGLGIVKNSAMALGALGAGVALSSVGVATAVAVDIATFGLAALLFRNLELPAAVAHGARRASHSARSYLAGKPRLVLMIGAFAAATFATGLMNTILPRFFQHELHTGPAGYAFGVGALACGLALGEAVVGLTRIGASAGRWVGIGLVVAAGLFGLLALGEQPAAAFLFVGLIGFVDGSTDILFDLTIQRDTHPRYLGAVFGFASAAMSTTMVFAFALAPLLTAIVQPRGVVAIAGVFFLVGGLVATAARSLDRRPAPQPQSPSPSSSQAQPAVPLAEPDGEPV